MRHFSILPILFVFFVGCNTIDLSTEKVQTSIVNTETITPEEALSNLELFINSHNRVTTKASENFTLDIRSIEAIGSEMLSVQTKANNTIHIPDTLFYIANLSKGFAVLAGNKELESDVFCLTESGELNGKDFSEAFAYLNSTEFDDVTEESTEIGPKVVPAILLSAILNEYQMKIITKSSFTDTDRDEDGNLKTEETLSGTKTGPFLKTKWLNSTVAPFNTYTPNKVAPGCVAIAVAQIMEYNRKSNTMVFNNVTCDWDVMETVCRYDNINYKGTEAAREQVGNFIYEIGKKHNCYIRYDNGSGAVADGAKRTFENYGYKNVDKRIGFASGDKKKVKEQILDGRPVYMGGCVKGSLTNGHTWVIDGLLGDYYHINWGWQGLSDGYYKIGVFTTSSRSAIDSEIDYQETGTNPGSYTWTYRIVLYSL